MGLLPLVAATPTIYLAFAVLALGIGAAAMVILLRDRRLYTQAGAARVDRATGLQSRLAWSEQVNREIVRSRRYGEPFCVALLDFGPSSRSGEDEGPEPEDLAALVTRWRGSLRASDELARYGRGRFAILMLSCRGADARGAVERLRSTVRDGELPCGLASWNGEEGADTLIARAELALGRARRAGGVTICANGGPDTPS